MTKFVPGDPSVFWQEHPSAGRISDYGILFVSASIFEAYLFARLCHHSEHLQLFGAATTETEARDLIEAAADRKLIVLIADTAAPDSGRALAQTIADRKDGSMVFLIINDIEKYCTLARSLGVYNGIISASGLGRGGIKECLEFVLSNNQPFLDPRLAASEASQDRAVSLSQREMQILPLLTRGLTNREIAASLFIAEKTARDYVSSILEKLNLASRAAVAAWAARHGITEV